MSNFELQEDVSVESHKPKIQTFGKEKITLVVESKVRPVGISEYSAASFWVSGFVYERTTKRRLISGRTLDARQRKLVESTRLLAEMLAADLEIVDLAGEGVAGRFLRRLRRQNTKAPSLTFSEGIWNKFDPSLLLLEILSGSKPEDLIELVLNQLRCAHEERREVAKREQLALA